MKEYLTDASGTHALEHVVAITPLADKPVDGKPARVRATLHLTGGQHFHTDTDYVDALEAWGAHEPAPSSTEQSPK